MQKNEYLLADQLVRGNKKIKNDDFKNCYIQQTNRKILGLPVWVWIYEIGKLGFNKKALKRKYTALEVSYDQQLLSVPYQSKNWHQLQEVKKKKLEGLEHLMQHGNWLMRIGERPVLYSAQQRVATEGNLLQYLYTKGFFKAQVKSFVKKRNNKAYVVYSIQENRPFIIKDISLYTEDSGIARLLQPYSEYTLLKKDVPYDQELLGAERTRIYEFLSNQGYWNFKKSYIAFNVDTTSQAQEIAIETVISLLPNDNPHPVYRLAHVQFQIDSTDPTAQSQEVENYQGVVFSNTKPYFSPSTMGDKILMRVGQLYSKNHIIETQKRLIRLGIFQNMHIEHVPLDDGQLAVNIRTKLFDKFQIEQEIGTEVTNMSYVPFYSLSLKGRNPFKHLETLLLKAQFGVEAGTFSTVKVQDQKKYYPEGNAQLSVELTWPHLLLPLRTTTKSSLAIYKPMTKLQIGYTFVQQRQYDKQSIKVLLAYAWQPDLRTTVELTPIGIGIADFNLNQAFKKELEVSKKRKYESSLIDYSSVKIAFKQDDKHPNGYRCLEILLENGGTLQHLIPFEKLLGNSLTYYQYFKTHVSYKRHILLYKGVVLAYQLNAGMLYPYSAHGLAPEDRYYFIGGPNNVRAWQPKSLGPGSYVKRNANEESVGEIMLQGNIEWRQHLVGFVESAFFIDAGNVWMHKQSEKKGEDFAFNRFYQEIAVGMGVGLRLNFNFLVFRADVGFKLYDPALPRGNRLFPSDMLHPEWNFGLVYPF
eukprot:gene2939-3665_t